MGKSSILNVSFSKALNEAFSNYAKFTGRSSRSEYWWVLLFDALVVVPLSIIEGILAINNAITAMVIFAALIVIFRIVMFIPEMSLIVRRLHDIGKSGWWFFIVFLPIFGGIILLVFTLCTTEMFVNAYGGVDDFNLQQRTILDVGNQQIAIQYNANNFTSSQTPIHSAEDVSETKTGTSIRYKTNNVIEKYTDLGLEPTIGMRWKMPILSILATVPILCIFIICLIGLILGFWAMQNYRTEVKAVEFKKNKCVKGEYKIVKGEFHIYSDIPRLVEDSTYRAFDTDITIDVTNTNEKALENLSGRIESERLIHFKDFSEAIEEYQKYLLDHYVFPGIAGIIPTGLILIIIYMFYFRKRSRLCEIANYIEHYEWPILPRPDYHIFVKDGMFGLVNCHSRKVIVSPIYDMVEWYQKNKILYAKKDGETILVHVPSGKELK